ncbi:hypothetical protein [Vulcanisaeta sp. JCM 14467]|nr:hypothetical protein [Vulcanisaeta sp. JCM 14467]
MNEGEEEFIPHGIHMWFGYLKGRVVTKEEGARYSILLRILRIG